MKTEILNSYTLSFSAFLSLGGITLKATILKFENTCDKLVCAFLIVQSFVYRYCNLLPSNNLFVLVFVVRISFVKKAGIFRPLWYKEVDHLFIKRPFFLADLLSTSAIFQRDTDAWAVKSAPMWENLWSHHRFFPNRPACRTQIARALDRHLHAPICFTISRDRQIGMTNRSV